ncbi:MAG: sialate O-acetylesterase [Muribaculaceae bacterium]|nr:sialate O-acetylesterase [Muribaculaceae bacterium]
MNYKLIKAAFVGLLPLVATGASAKVELPEIISDNAVLQQNSNAKLWGWAKPGATVKVSPSWDNKSYLAKSDAKSGRWELSVPTPGASFTPYSVTFDDGDGTEKIDNVLIGEVWFCSGQSNMEMPLRGYGIQPIEGAAQAVAYSGKYPGIRMANIPKRAAYTPQDKVEGKWKVSNPADAGEFSALAYFFAQSLTDILNVPIGIINCAYGGSKVEGWIPKWKLDTYPGWDMDAEEKKDDMGEWERIGVMYNAMLKPVLGYTVKGFLWNQGESNVGRHDEYPEHQKDMVEIWRDEWGLGELPFYFVELPGWDYGDPEKDDAAKFRESQHRGAEILPNSGIVCTTDLVYPYEVPDIHARKKKEIGERLAFMAAARTYGINGIPNQYPSYKSVELKGDKAVLTFNNATGGLNPNMNLPGFEVAGEDQVFYPAVATEDWNYPYTVTVSSDKVKDIKAVRYCFKNFAIGQLKDMYGLPLIPFRTDNW